MGKERLSNSLQDHRRGKGWTQDDLARRAGVSRAEVSGIETSRLVPSAQVALALAEVLGCRVEDLFRLERPAAPPTLWAWPPAGRAARYWRAAVAGRTLLYPAEATACGVLPHDGRGSGTAPGGEDEHDAQKTLVLAGCDPAARLLEAELERQGGFRLLALTRSSRGALGLLRDRLVHVAGVHLAESRSRSGNEKVVRELLGSGYRLLRLARWEEGIALGRGLQVKSVRAAVRAHLSWVGREEGSGARACLDLILETVRRGRRPPGRQARDHQGVVEAIRSGWAQAGICVRFPAAEAGLAFLPVRKEDYDLCYPADLEGDPRLAALVRAVQSASYRRRLADLEGYDPATTGEIQGVA